MSDSGNGKSISESGSDVHQKGVDFRRKRVIFAGIAVRHCVVWFPLARGFCFSAMVSMTASHCDSKVSLAGRWQNMAGERVTQRCHLVVDGRMWRRTVGQNQVVLRHLIIPFPTSSGVSERAVRSK